MLKLAIAFFLGSWPLLASAGATLSNGILTISQTSDPENLDLDLKGKWEFYWQAFIEPTAFKSQTTKPSYINVPGSWRGYNLNNQILPGHGYATYRLVAKGLIPGKIYFLKVDSVGTAYTLWLNGKKAMAAGVPGKNAETTLPYVPSQSLQHYADVSELEIVFHIANFHDLNGGFWGSVQLAAPNAAFWHTTLLNFFDFGIFGALLIMALYHLLIFFLRKKEIPALLLGICAFIVAVRTLTIGERLLVSLLGAELWPVAFKINYLTFSLSIPVFTYFFYSLYFEQLKHPLNKILLWGISGTMLLFSTLILFTGSAFYTSFLWLMQILLLIAILYVIVNSMILIWSRQKKDIYILMAGFLVLTTGIVNDILFSQNVYLTSFNNLSSVGLFFFFFAQSAVLSLRFTGAFRSTELLTDDLRELNHANSRFVPSEMLSLLEKKSIRDLELGDQIQKEMTVLFADIRSFTALSESMAPKEIFDFLNEYLNQIGPQVRMHRGFIDKYIGDAIMALFPASPDDAIAAALSIQTQVDLFNKNLEASGRSPIAVGIGIHTGLLMLGTIGEAERMEGTVISDAVNIASRIEGLTKDFKAKIIISASTLSKLSDSSQFNIKALGETEIRGKQQSVALFAVSAAKT